MLSRDVKACHDMLRYDAAQMSRQSTTGGKDECSEPTQSHGVGLPRMVDKGDRPSDPPALLGEAGDPARDPDTLAQWRDANTDKR